MLNYMCVMSGSDGDAAVAAAAVFWTIRVVEPIRMLAVGCFFFMFR